MVVNCMSYNGENVIVVAIRRLRIFLLEINKIENKNELFLVTFG